MGTVSSTSKDQTLKVNEYLDESNDYEFKFNYIKKDLNKNKSFQQSETTENTKKIETNDLIPIKFEWKEGGNDVKITGTFLENWKRQETLQKNPYTNLYEINLNLNKGIHQFKFIVNDKWVCSPYYKIVKDKNDNNNYNNEIDTSNYINSQENESTTMNSTTKNTSKKIKRSVDYNSKFPDKSEFNSDAPEIPYHYKNNIDLNYYSNQGKLNEEDYNLKYNKSKNILENESFKSITTIPHDKLTHLFINCNNNDININKSTFLRCSMTQRNKHKFITVVYFSPKK